jgi:hypothetical protein
MSTMSVKSPLGLVLYCYLNMPTINKTYIILFYPLIYSLFKLFILKLPDVKTAMLLLKSWDLETKGLRTKDQALQRLLDHWRTSSEEQEKKSTEKVCYCLYLNPYYSFADCCFSKLAL